MNVTEARYANFAALFRQFRDENSDKPDKGMLKLFAERLDLSPRYMSHIKCERKPIGHATARQIEQQLGLDEGWMDQVHDELDPADANEQEYVRLALVLYRSDPRGAMSMMLGAVEQRLRPVQTGT